MGKGDIFRVRVKDVGAWGVEKSREEKKHLDETAKFFTHFTFT